MDLILQEGFRLLACFPRQCENNTIESGTNGALITLSRTNLFGSVGHVTIFN